MNNNKYEWAAIPFSRGSSQPRDWTQVSRIAGELFTSWATREAPSDMRWASNSALFFSLVRAGFFVVTWKSESEVTQSCWTLCDPVDRSPPGSSVHGILQARILEWVAISFSRGSSRPRDQTQVSCIAGRHFNLWPTRELTPNPKLSSYVFRWWIHNMNLKDDHLYP